MVYLQNTFGTIITSLIQAGLKIQEIKEYPHTYFKQFPYMEEKEKGVCFLGICCNNTKFYDHSTNQLQLKHDFALLPQGLGTC